MIGDSLLERQDALHSWSSSCIVATLIDLRGARLDEER